MEKICYSKLNTWLLLTMRELYYLFSELYTIYKATFNRKNKLKRIVHDLALFLLVICWFIFFLLVAIAGVKYLENYLLWVEWFFVILSILSIKFVYLLTIRTIYKFWKNNSLVLLFARLTLHILLFITAFAFIFFYINILFPGAFSINSYKFLDYFYYSAVTFTTLWYWDMLPITWTAKFFATIEIISGYILIILMVSNVHNMKDSVKKLSLESNKEWYLVWYNKK